MTTPTKPFAPRSPRTPVTGIFLARTLWWPPTLLAALIWWSADLNYLLFHFLAELLSIVIAMGALVVATTSVRFTRNHFVVFLAVAIGWCAPLDLFHTLAFKGMNLLGNQSDSANPATQLWIAARSMEAFALALAPLMLRRSVRLLHLHLAFGAWTLLSAYLIVQGHYPDAFIDNVGLTPFKINAEYAIIALLGLALLQLWRKRTLMSRAMHLTISLAVVATMASEFAFTQYASVVAQSNLVGHLLKVYACWFIFSALVQNTLREPFSAMSRAASSYDAVPQPALIVASDGIIQQANLAAASYLGRSPAQLVDCASHTLLHDASLPAADCPACQRLQGKREASFVTLDLPDGRMVECHLAPFAAPIEGQQVWVEVIVDITDRQRMAREREHLIDTLGERVKELRCLNAVTDLIRMADITVPRILEGLVGIIPSGFSDPTQLRVFISGNWGSFGIAPPARTPRLHMAVEFNLGKEETVRIEVYYPDDGTNPPPFLAEEKTLMQNISMNVSQAFHALHGRDRVRRLSCLYEMLSKTNRAVTYSQDREELLQAFKDALLRNGAFDKLFIALTDTGRLPAQLAFHHGVEGEALRILANILGNPASPLSRIQGELNSGKVVVQDVATMILNPREREDVDYSRWIDYLRASQINQRAFVPLLGEGRLMGIVGLYAPGHSEFDAEQIRLLENMAADIRFAFDRFAADKGRQEAEATALEMEFRFQEVFRASPVPMQIHAVTEPRTRSINEAHMQWLGYTLEEIAADEDWFAKVYEDEPTRIAVRAAWAQALQNARAGQVAESPELSLRCKDGSMRLARGTVTVVNEDAIIAWTDLTEIRHSERALRESEQRFRSMVEQTVSGMFVWRDRQYIYVNPRYCEMTGYSAEELLGKDVLENKLADPEVLAEIESAWAPLQDGASDNFSFTVPQKRKDGQIIEMGLNARVITWDDGLPATIVMAQDITERKRAEERISTYVKQLEAAMRGTFQAVSNMVELRDPYTAGHERRVGLIAGAIAREMGWDEERCKNLELLGLVHDIGKVAIPSEILTKPTRLSKLEMELMKGHAEAGYDILKDVPFPTPVAEIIRQHHERIDGSGYPRGLKGDEILIEARVLAVADVLESMASHRPYRAAVGLDAALNEIVRNRGKLYDPAVTDAAIELINKKGYQLPK